jgi:3-hydroxyisobutyrate dehydrogenase
MRQEDSMNNIAFLGLGHMGAPIASRLVDAGHQVTVWNRSAEKAAPLTERGARRADTPAEAAAGADVVITMLSDERAVREVLLGDDGVLSVAKPGTLLIEMSTIGPDAVRALHAELPEGVALVDAPVAGGPKAAADGTLVILAGGDSAEVDRAEEVLKAAGTLRRCGGKGAGASLKLVVNLGVIDGVALAAEALALARDLGLPDDLTLSVLRNGPIGGAVARSRDPESNFSIALAAKDLRLAAVHRDLPITRTVLDLMSTADQSAELGSLVEHARALPDQKDSR